METAFHKQINYANAYGNEGGRGLLCSWESVCSVVVVVVGGPGGADDNTRVPFSAVNRQELAARTLSCNIYCVRTSLRLHTAPASSVSPPP